MLVAFRSNFLLQRSKRPSKVRAQLAVITFATVSDFQKLQCHFNLSVQISTLVLASRSTRPAFAFSDVYNVVGNIAFVIIAVNSFVPVIFSLTCIAQFGRPTWYITGLTLSCYVIWLAAIILSYGNHPTFAPGNLTSDVDVCSNHIVEHLEHWCASLGGYIGPTSTYPWIYGRVYFIWVHSSLWMLYCLTKPDLKSLPTWLSHLLTFFYDHMPFIVWIRGVKRITVVRQMWFAFFIITSLGAFGSQINLNSSFFQQDLVSKTWSSGQVVAVLFWPLFW